MGGILQKQMILIKANYFTSAVSLDSNSVYQCVHLRFLHFCVRYVVIHYVKLYVNKKHKQLHKQHVGLYRDIASVLFLKVKPFKFITLKLSDDIHVILIIYRTNR